MTPGVSGDCLPGKFKGYASRFSNQEEEEEEEGGKEENSGG